MFIALLVAGCAIAGIIAHANLTERKENAEESRTFGERAKQRSAESLKPGTAKAKVHFALKGKHGR